MWSAALSGPLGIGATAAASYVLMTQGPAAVGLSEYLPQKPKPPRTVMARPAAKIISVH